MTVRIFTSEDCRYPVAVFHTETVPVPGDYVTVEHRDDTTHYRVLRRQLRINSDCVADVWVLAKKVDDDFFMHTGAMV